MRRWRFFSTPWFGVRLHHILRSDADLELHDHPFSFLSIVLAGGYTEFTPDERPMIIPFIVRNPDLADHIVRRRWFGPGSIIFRRAEDLHRLELKKVWDETGNNAGPPGYLPQLVERSAWTLVFRGPVRRKWDFRTDKGWVDAKAFESRGNAGVGMDGE
jgi:hypothetical protein